MGRGELTDLDGEEPLSLICSLLNTGGFWCLYDFFHAPSLQTPRRLILLCILLLFNTCSEDTDWRWDEVGARLRTKDEAVRGQNANAAVSLIC